ncbi:AAA family ATPase [Agromyces sp. SYSU T00194]|uniref:AAA family ATPase n=1 Tax=Agromyces chitinivorans TaxID=3158560 RepID=UPI0033910F27
MSRYTLVSRSAEYETRLRRLFRARVTPVPGEYLAFGAQQVVAQMTSAPRIVLLGPLLSFDETKSVAAELSERYPGIGIVVVREQRSDLEDWIDAMDIHAVLSPDASDQTITSLIERLDDWLVAYGRLPAAPAEVDDEDDSTETADTSFLMVAEQQAEPEPEPEPEPPAEEAEPEEEWILPPPLEEGVRSEIIVVTAPKGGQGKTTTSINLAVGLAEVHPNSVVLVDADLQFGDIANALSLTPRTALADLIASMSDELALKTQLTRHEDDFFVAAAPDSPELADEVSPQNLGALIQNLSTQFRYVVVDTSPGLGEHTLAAIEQSTDAVFVTNMTVPSLRALRKELKLLVDIELLPSNRHVVLNFVDKKSGITVGDAEHIIGADIGTVVPRSGAVVFASNQGEPLIHFDVRDPAAGALRELVQKIEPSAVPTRRRIHRKSRAS